MLCEHRAACCRRHSHWLPTGLPAIEHEINTLLENTGKVKATVMRPFSGGHFTARYFRKTLCHESDAFAIKSCYGLGTAGSRTRRSPCRSNGF